MADNDYRSVEEIVMSKLAIPARAMGRTAYNFGEYFIRAVYATPVGLLRIPTTVRKSRNNQMWMERIPPKHTDEVNGSANGSNTPSEDRIVGALAGFISCLSGLVYGAYELVSEAYQGNLAPAIITGAVIGATNAASLMFELGRKSQRRERISLEHEISIAA